MKIYFAGSIRGGRQDVDLYLQIITYLQTKGEVLTEHIGSAALSTLGEDGVTDKFIHDRDIDWLLASDVIVAEVTNASLGVGYELGRAYEHRKKVLCLYRPQQEKKLSAMIRGSNFTIEDYSTFEQAIQAIDKFFARLSNNTTP